MLGLDLIGPAEVFSTAGRIRPGSYAVETVSTSESHSSTPARYVEGLRLERARIALSESSQPVAAVARRCGFGTATTMRRVFERRLRIRPSDYRARFQPALGE